MEEQHELYEYAEKIEVKKGLYLHFVLLFLARFVCLHKLLILVRFKLVYLRLHWFFIVFY
jgi:hypothetical protein